MGRAPAAGKGGEGAGTGGRARGMEKKGRAGTGGEIGEGGGRASAAGEGGEGAAGEGPGLAARLEKEAAVFF